MKLDEDFLSWLIYSGIGVVAAFFWIASAVAHPGGLSQDGGHFQRSTGGYHFHAGPYAGLFFDTIQDAQNWLLADWEYETVVEDREQSGERFVYATMHRGGQICEVVFDTGDNDYGPMTAVNWCQRIRYVWGSKHPVGTPKPIASGTVIPGAVPMPGGFELPFPANQ